MNESDSRSASPVVRRSPALRFRRAFPLPPPNNAGRGGQDVPLRSRSLQRSPATCPPSRCETAHQPSDHSTTILSLVPSRSHSRSPEAGNRKPEDSRRRPTTAHEHVQPAAHRGRTLRCPARLATTYAPMVPAHAPCVVRLEMTTGRVKPAAMGTALLNILSTSPMLRATDRAHPRGARLRSRVGLLGWRCHPCDTRTGRVNRSAVRSRPDCPSWSHRVRAVAVHYSHPRSRNAERPTPGGANQPPAPYLAPSLSAISLLP